MAEIKSLEQLRAKLAWEFINSISKKDFDKVSTAARKLPALIFTSGLGQTVAFYLSKDETKKVIDNLAVFLSENTGIEGITRGNDLLEKIMKTDHETYILLSKEAIKYATWLKRFAEAELEG